MYSDRISKSIVKKNARKKPCPYVIFDSVKTSHGFTHFRLTGDRANPLIVLIHGLNGTMTTYAEYAETLTKYGNLVLTYDMYGHGLSSCPSFDVTSGIRYAPNFFVRQLYDLLEALGMQNAHLSLTGFSLGCVVAAAYGVAYPTLVDKIMLISPAGLIPDVHKVVKVLRKFPCLVKCIPCCIHECMFFNGDTQRVGFEIPPEGLQPTTIIIHSEPTGIDNKKHNILVGEHGHESICGICKYSGCTASVSVPRSQYDELVPANSSDFIKSTNVEATPIDRLRWTIFSKKKSIQSFLACITRMPLWESEDLYSSLGRLGIPVLVLWGTADTVAPFSGAGKMNDIISNSLIIAMKDQGHLVIASRPYHCAAVACTYFQLPFQCDIQEYRQYLPINVEGSYVHPIARAPPGMLSHEYTACNGFQLERIVTLRQSIKYSGVVVAKQGSNNTIKVGSPELHKRNN